MNYNISTFTYYAGNKRTLSAVATMAHWAIDGYMSDIVAVQVWVLAMHNHQDRLDPRIGSGRYAKVTCTH